MTDCKTNRSGTYNKKAILAGIILCSLGAIILTFGAFIGTPTFLVPACCNGLMVTLLVVQYKHATSSPIKNNDNDVN